MPRSFEVVSFDVDPRSRNRGRGAANFLSNPEFLMRIYDRNRDGKLTEAEVSRNRGLSRVFDRLLEVGDRNKDGGLDVAEFNELPPPDFARQRGSTEYFMPDLNDPSSEGERIDPVFFVNKTKPKSGLNDVERRESLARSITSRKNPWFAKAFVYRIWGELLGQGFYMPIDDLGPERKADYPEVLDLLSDGFTASGYDVKWLFRTIANTHTYQRQIQSVDASESTIPFVAATPTRLRGDQVYNAILKVLGTNELGRGRRGFRPIAGGGGYPGPQTPRVLFGFIFGFDPSTPQEDIIGSVPQALFMMNSSLINGMVRGSGNTRLGTILRNNRHDADAVKELYLLVLSRQPSDKEIEICLDYVGGNSDRQEAFEDVMWGLLNSSEFLTKR
jgi:hypothetical protein